MRRREEIPRATPESPADGLGDSVIRAVILAGGRGTSWVVGGCVAGAVVEKKTAGPERGQAKSPDQGFALTQLRPGLPRNADLPGSVGNRWLTPGAAVTASPPPEEEAVVASRALPCTSPRGKLVVPGTTLSLVLTLPCSPF